MGRPGKRLRVSGVLENSVYFDLMNGSPYCQVNTTMPRFFHVFSPWKFLLILLLSASCNNPHTETSDVNPEHLFTFEVLPLLQNKCFGCHGDDPAKVKGELNMLTREGLLQGGESGHPALIPGSVGKSSVYQAVTRKDPELKMPPKDSDKLSTEQIQLLETWIAGGAPWPDSTRRQELLATVDWQYGGKIRVETSLAESEAWQNRGYATEDVWAFMPLAQVQVPEVGAGHPIDAFVEQKLREAGIRAGKAADKRTLIRRATFDLTGLPPAPEAVAAFVADDAPDAYERLVDQLLASPHYGEQWGRHWLDVVRYADSDGFSNDYARPNAWRYRDYVIRAFNDDKAYNQFIREQIAGDEIDPDNPEMLIAAGFLRMGPWEHTAMSIEAETRQFFLDDVTNSVGETFLSTPLRCARCHDHKFDPIPTRDFYRIQAVFATTQFASRPAPYLPVEQPRITADEQERITMWLEDTQAAQEAITQKEEDAAKAWYRQQGKRYLPKRQRMKLPESQRPPRYLGLDYHDLGFRKVLQKRMQTLGREKEGFEPLAFSVYSGPSLILNSGRPMRIPESLEGEAQPTFILTGGSVHAPADSVGPGVMSAVQSLQAVAPATPEIPAVMEGRRQAFAEWLSSPDNPLVVRSIVNRVWQYHFGKGIAENPNNFGATGKKPSHPELLDWLAHAFIQNGWSIKYLHRLIMSSEAYQRSSQHRDLKEIRQKDPDNLLLAVFSPRRLEAEELRDAMLFLSGELNPELGGVPIRPEINREVAMQPRQIMGSLAQAYQPSRTPSQRNRRTIYAARYRGLPDPLLEVFNQPGPDLSCERRTASSVTPQVFTLFNGEATRARALAMAQLLSRELDDPKAQVREAALRIRNRPFSPEELNKATDYLKNMITYHEEHKPEKTRYPTTVSREMFEEMTGVSFTYEERLDIYENYTPDLKAWQVEPPVRALADLIHVLFNSNEFMYVY